MTIILVTQDTGAHGDEVAVGLATSLGFGLVPQERVEQRVAERMHINEGTVHRLLGGRAMVTERWMIRPRQLARHVAEEIAKLAPRGDAVIQGCAGTTVWRLVPHVICVHVCGGAGLACRSPGSRGAYATRWLSAGGRGGLESYDPGLNAERLTVEECVRHVRRFAQRPNAQPIASAPQVLGRVVRQTSSGCQPIQDVSAGYAAPSLKPSLEVEVAGETIRLPAAISREEAIACVEQHLRGKRDSAAVSAHGYSHLINQSIV